MAESVYYRRLYELAAYFARLGTTAFGGPAAHIALMEEECVRRRKWITHERFLDVLGAANLIPGPTSTELAMHIGYERAGWLGLVTAGVCFIAPAAIIVGVLAALYVDAGALPSLAGVLRIVKPVVIAVVAAAVVGLARAVRWSPMLLVVAAGSAVLALRGVNEVVILAVAGVAYSVSRSASRYSAAAVVPLPEVFVHFVKAGSLVLGSGYVLLPILRDDVVQRMRWISEAQLLDAIAVGQVTPGPIFTTATFIGYLIAGTGGAIVATVGVFLPAFVFSAISVKVLARIGNEGAARWFLDGVNVAAVVLIVLVVAGLARHAIVDALTACAAVVAAICVTVLRVNAAVLIVAAAVLGLFL